MNRRLIIGTMVKDSTLDVPHLLSLDAPIHWALTASASCKEMAHSDSSVPYHRL
jgi:hypothetical protein